MEAEKVLWPGWETVRLIGRGSFGAVYEIERDVHGHKEKAALKVITIPQSDSDIDELYDSGYDEASITETFKSHLQSIVNEYILMREMNGAANVVNCDDFRTVQHDDKIGWDIFIKMELLTPLTKAVGKRSDDEQVIQIAKDMCKALSLCKKYGIIHRDIKPQNIFVSKNGDYKLGDFGIAKTVEKTSGGTKIGTYKFMAPEVYNNQPYNLTADIYSLGLVLHWLLNERRAPFMPLPPIPAEASQEEEARLRRFRGETIPAPIHGSEALKRIVLKACAYEPKDRYQSAEEMLKDLNSLGVTASKDSDAPAEIGVDSQLASGGAMETVTLQDEQTENGTVSAFDHHPSPAESKPKKKAWSVIVGSLAAILVLVALAFYVPGWTPATCETPETHRLFGFTRGEALGHAYGEWTITTEPTCTEEGRQERVCKNDPAHKETQAVPAAGHQWIDPSCTDPSVCSVCGESSGEALGHDWGEPSYTWSSDNSSITAKRVCARCGYSEIEKVQTTSEVTTAATCTSMGKTTYTASFQNAAFSTQTKTVQRIAALGHDWGEPSYSWTTDYRTVMAKRKCTRCEHSETETVQTTSNVTTAATCTGKGKTTYTATFKNSAFSTQTKTVENVAALGHKWGAPTYTWTSDYKTVMAKRKCTRCEHSETETVQTTSNVTTAATCTEKGKTTYTASFQNAAFSTQTKTEENVTALGHNWDKPIYTWTSDYASVMAKRKCTRCPHSEGETVQTTSEVANAATCINSGWTTYTANFQNIAFSKQTKTVENIAALGHDWVESTYSSPQTCRRCGKTVGDVKGYIGNVPTTWLRSESDWVWFGGYGYDQQRFNQPIENCRSVVLWINPTVSGKRSPYCDWTLYGKNENGEWIALITVDVYQTPDQVIPFVERFPVVFSTPTYISSIVCVPSNGFDGWYNYGLEDIQIYVD